MKPIATWSFKPWLTREGTWWERTEYMLAVARAAICYADQHFGRPTIYTDKLGQEIFSQLTNRADIEVVHEDTFDYIHPRLWGLAKIKTYAMQKEPFIHFDLDFWFKQPLTADQWNCDLLCHGIEVLNAHNVDPSITRHYNMWKVGDQYDLPEVFKYEDPLSIPAYNMGCAMFRNMELHRLYIDNVLDLIERNKRLFRYGPILSICEVEQHTIGMILDRHRHFKVKTIFKPGWENPPINDQAVHFVGTAYKTNMFPQVVQFCRTYVDPWINETVWRLTDQLNEMRKLP